jgi:hypothetical protein
MISVRKEWKKIKTDEELLAWTKKWGALLMETFQNPIWASGYAKGKSDILDQLEQINKGEYPDDMEPVIEEYANALSIVRKNIKVAQFFLQGSREVMLNLDNEQLLRIAAEEMSKQLVKHIHMDIEEENDESLKVYFSLVMVDD